MAIIKCPECGQDVSDKAAACPHCGYPINPNANAGENTSSDNSSEQTNYSNNTSSTNNEYTNPNTNTAPQEKKTSSCVDWIIAIALLLFIVGMIGSCSNGCSGSSSSAHTCEVSGCSRSGTHSIVGFNGTTEYYCSKHYNQLKDNMNTILGDN